MNGFATGLISPSNGHDCSCGTFPLVEIRPARAADATQCRGWLPQAFPVAGWTADLHVAVLDGALVAAAAMAWVPGGFPVLLHVEPDWRRRGIGRALVTALARTASSETWCLRGWTMIDEDSAGYSFARATGFETQQRLVVFETDGVEFEAAMTSLLGRAAARLPSDFMLMTLAEAPAASLLDLVAEHMRQPPEHVAALITPGAANGYDRDLSLVISRNGEAIGAMLCRREPDHLLVDVNVVAPAYRRGPANLMLIEAIARRGRAANVETFRFSCEEHVRDTINLARRSGARSLPAQHRMVLPIAESHG